MTDTYTITETVDWSDRDDKTTISFDVPSLTIYNSIKASLRECATDNDAYKLLMYFKQIYTAGH
jgi:hypothetical protein